MINVFVQLFVKQPIKFEQIIIKFSFLRLYKYIRGVSESKYCTASLHDHRRSSSSVLTLGGGGDIVLKGPKLPSLVP